MAHVDVQRRWFPAARPWSVRPPSGSLVKGLAAPFAYIGSRAMLMLDTLASLFRRPFRFGLIVQQMQYVGVQSLPIVGLVGLFSGAVAAESTLAALAIFRQENAVGGLVGVSLARELGPVFASLMLSARSGAGMAAELGSMRMSEQVDALTTFGINPVQYLILPRVLACVVMTPVMTMVFNIVGLFGAYVVAIVIKTSIRAARCRRSATTPIRSTTSRARSRPSSSASRSRWWPVTRGSTCAAARASSAARRPVPWSRGRSRSWCSTTS